MGTIALLLSLVHGINLAARYIDLVCQLTGFGRQPDTVLLTWTHLPCLSVITLASIWPTIDHSAPGCTWQSALSLGDSWLIPGLLRVL